MAVAAAVAVAFADSSIVVLALPDVYGAFDTSIVGVSWVITAYNLVVAVVAFALVPLIRRVDVGRVSRLGLLLFFAGSVGSAASWNLPALIAFRCLQGVGAAMLLAGALALLAALTGSAVRGVAIWTAAGTFGAAAGPALGGILTELFEWRAIFAFQAPVALIASRRGIRVAPAPARGGRAAEQPRREPRPRLSLRCARRGALPRRPARDHRLGLSPIAGAAVVSALLLAALASRLLQREPSPRLAASAGALLLASGLVALALLPATSEAIVAIALALCGTGLGLAVPVLTHAAVHPGPGVVRSGTATIGARHAGLVVALVLIAPLLSHELDRGGHQALLGGAKVILDGNDPAEPEVPDHAPPLNGARAGPEGRRARPGRAFRQPRRRARREPPPGEGLADRGARGRGDAELPQLVRPRGAARPARARPDPLDAQGVRAVTSHRGKLILGGLAAVAVVLIALELALGALDFETPKLADPCTASRVPGRGLDGAVQRLALSGLDGAACKLGTSREELVLSFSPAAGAKIRWSRRDDRRRPPRRARPCGHRHRRQRLHRHRARLPAARDRGPARRLVPGSALDRGRGRSHRDGIRTLQVAPPAGQHRVHRRGADDRLAGAGSSFGYSRNGRVCGPPSPPWKEISSSNAQPSSRSGS